MNFESVGTSKGSILVVDDSAGNLRAVSMMLTKRGYKVRRATNGETALASIANCLPDLILLDIYMPVMDGYEVCRQLKAKSTTKDIPIIFLSAADDVTGKVKAFAMGGADYVTKPFQTEEILARIANQLTIQRLQKQLTEKNQRLQQEINEHEKTLVALQDAKEVAEAANDAKNKFLATMSHELRTPLNAVLGFTGLMMNDSSFPQEYQGYLASISDSGQHLLKLLNHVLTVTSAESGKISLNEHCFDLHHLIETIATTYQLNATTKGLQFFIKCAPTVPRYVRSDESKLRQVLMGLLENAIQFTQEGRVTLRVHLGQQDSSIKERAHSLANPLDPLPIALFFEIEDTGAGIASHEINHLFQVFSQTEAGQRSERGLGLGLFISRRFVQAMGGDITLDSTPKQKTVVRFHVLVQLVETDCVQPSVQATECAINSSVQSLAEPPPTFTQERVLEVMRTELSAAWLTQLHEAAIKGFDLQISQLIQEMPATYAPLARTLTYWNQNFQFDRIVSLTQQVLEQAP